MGNSKLITTASLSFALVGMIMVSGISPTALAANIPVISVDPSDHPFGHLGKPLCGTNFSQSPDGPLGHLEEDPLLPLSLS